jgi:hypothetical protein
MYHPAMVLAYYLDPRYRGKSLSQEHSRINFLIEEASKLINRSLNSQLAREMLEYQSKSGVFNLNVLWSDEATKNPTTWWSALKNEVPVLSELAAKLMSIPASSAAAERNWSHFGFVHSLRRNRLTNDRVFKLVYIYSNLHLNDKVTNDNINSGNLGDTDNLLIEDEDGGDNENENDESEIENEYLDAYYFDE